MKKKGSSKTITHILSVLFILLILLELQIMINYPDKFLWFVGIGAVILINVYFLVFLFVKQKDQNQDGKEEQFENIAKSEKASYLLLKKCFQDLDERMTKLEEQITPIGMAVAENKIKVQEGLNQSITDNKKVAKILLGRTKENTDALMNSNNELRKVLNNFGQKLSEMEEKIYQINDSSREGGSNADQYQEILSSIQNLELSLRSQVKQANFSNYQNNTDLMEDLESLEDIGTFEETDTLEDLESLEDIGTFEETDLIAESDFSENNEPIEEIGFMEDLDFEEEQEPVSAIQTLQKMKKEEKVPMPDLSDPNKVMSPEEIAALIANM